MLLPKPWQNFLAAFAVIVVLGSPTFFMGLGQANKQTKEIPQEPEDIPITEMESPEIAKKRKAAMIADQKAETKRNSLKLKAEADKIDAQKAEASRKSEEEYDSKGLVLLWKSVRAVDTQFLGMEITGIVVNRRPRTLSYAQITFNIYDESGAQVGSALANINGLESGGTWKFKAISFGKNGEKYKLSELTGF